ncbi:hypothetical protein [Streptomyces sp. ME19-01-6]|uniref:hypothetical protein n=1 Tax=Streptomyces sp. ME19-01-6 TaxID=3028686 RepID=UPI0029BEEE09|nr:hypothetical protein [Streptomyces sp. ME19-01-6]MDX3224602.1 hypothetical protein [Streptomyces sp. ME19-01-6]
MAVDDNAFDASEGQGAPSGRVGEVDAEGVVFQAEVGALGLHVEALLGCGQLEQGGGLAGGEEDPVSRGHDGVDQAGEGVGEAGEDGGGVDCEDEGVVAAGGEAGDVVQQVGASVKPSWVGWMVMWSASSRITA